MHVQEILSVTLILFSVIDIIGILPIIIDMKKKGVEIESAKASLVSLLIMVGFLFTGEGILKMLGVDVQSFAVAGALIIFFIGLEMILGIKLFREQTGESTKGTVVPVAFPLIAGAGTMTTIISMKAKYQTLDILIAIALNILLVYIVLKGSNWIQDKLGDAGAAVLRKVFGIILLAISIKLFKENFHLVITPDKKLGFMPGLT
ncbi:MAG: MarC family protein [Saprospiraceae bacterium]|nr:MarC family protein [Saprospiraceae bacterium]